MAVVLLKLDTGEDVLASDNGTDYKAYVKTGAVAPGGQIAQLGSTRESYLVARVRVATDLRLTAIRDFGLGSQVSDVSLAAGGTEVRVIKKFEDSRLADAAAVQFQLGDAVAIASTWSLDQLYAQEQDEGET